MAMLTRRVLLGSVIASALGFALSGNSNLLEGTGETLFKGKAKFDELLSSATEGHWNQLPIGKLMGKVGVSLVGTPYVGGTLDHSIDSEICTIDLGHLDCVTFFENTLDFSRMLLLDGSSEKAMLDQVTYTRYRSGHNTGYASRLHYTMDWIYDNSIKGVVKDVTGSLPGAVKHRFEVDYMSTHAHQYPQLKEHPDLIPLIRKFEEKISRRESYLVPLEALDEAEKHLQTGDIIGIGSPVPGLDIAHTGLIYAEDGIPHFMDATSVPSLMQVKLEGPIAERVRRMRGATGIVVARPITPVSKSAVSSVLG